MDNPSSDHRGNGTVNQVPEVSGVDIGLLPYSDESSGPVIEAGAGPVIDSELVIETGDVESSDPVVETEDVRMSDPIIEADDGPFPADETVFPVQSPATSSQAMEVVNSVDQVGQSVVAERLDRFDASVLVDAGARNTHAMVTRSKAGVFKPKAYHL
ncbi:hypothetical protein V6N13_064982 [Hibiscus sabdariffa]